MSKAWLVAKHEFLSNIRRRGFLFAALGVPLITIGAIYIVFAVTMSSIDNTDSVGQVGYVDESGVLAEALAKPANFTPYEDETAAGLALSDRELSMYFVLPENYLDTGTVRLYSNSTTPDGIQREIRRFLLANVGADIDPARLARIQNPSNERLLTLDNGRIIEENGIVGLFITPLLFVMVFMLASQTTSGYLMSGVVEEKSNRIMEILITSITPLQLLFGKIVGLGGLGLVQLGIWLGVGVVLTQVGQGIPMLENIVIPTDMLVLGVVYFFITYFLLASLMAGIGSVVAAEQESRQFAGIFSLLLFLPFFFMVNLITDSNGTVATILTLFPFTSPVTVILRMAFGVVPTWQIVASLTILLLTTVFVVWASARVFRWSLLMYGKRPSLRQLASAIRKAPAMQTSATGENAT